MTVAESFIEVCNVEVIHNRNYQKKTGTQAMNLIPIKQIRAANTEFLQRG